MEWKNKSIPMPKTKEKSEQKQQEIVDAAYQVFAKNGYHNTKISQIAKVLKMGHGTFYRYFRNKLDIFSHVVDRVIEPIAQVIEDDPPEVSNTLEEYREQGLRIGQRLLDIFLKDHQLAKILFVEIPGIDKKITRKVEQAMDEYTAITERYLINGQQKGFLNQELNTYIIARGINAMIFEGIQQVLAADNPEQSAREWTENLSTFFLNGMR